MVLIKKAGIKNSPASRITAGKKIGTAGPHSPFYAQPEMETSIDNVAASTAISAPRSPPSTTPRWPS